MFPRNTAPHHAEREWASQANPFGTKVQNSQWTNTYTTAKMQTPTNLTFELHRSYIGIPLVSLLVHPGFDPPGDPGSMMVRTKLP